MTEKGIGRWTLLLCLRVLPPMFCYIQWQIRRLVVGVMQRALSLGCRCGRQSATSTIDRRVIQGFGSDYI
jgi:hypothetical protein